MSWALSGDAAARLPFTGGEVQALLDLMELGVGRDPALVLLVDHGWNLAAAADAWGLASETSQPQPAGEIIPLVVGEAKMQTWSRNAVGAEVTSGSCILLHPT